MLEKGLQKSWKMLQKGTKMGAGIEKISIKMKVQKYIDFLCTSRAGDGRPGIHDMDFGGTLLVRYIPYRYPWYKKYREFISE